jgi:hypothetical protein
MVGYEGASGLEKESEGVAEEIEKMDQKGERR